ncbi:hypothetical protein [Bradyrhizobium sp. NAS80.1]|nr:hypothetical protein [Bradyrhizobium sp. NAS80.1]
MNRTPRGAFIPAPKDDDLEAVTAVVPLIAINIRSGVSGMSM